MGDYIKYKHRPSRVPFRRIHLDGKEYEYKMVDNSTIVFYSKNRKRKSLFFTNFSSMPSETKEILIKFLNSEEGKLFFHV